MPPTGIRPLHLHTLPTSATQSRLENLRHQSHLTYTETITGPLTRPFSRQTIHTYSYAGADKTYTSSWDHHGSLYTRAWTADPPPIQTPKLEQHRSTTAVNSSTPTHTYIWSAALSGTEYSASAFIAEFPSWVTTSAETLPAARTHTLTDGSTFQEPYLRSAAHFGYGLSSLNAYFYGWTPLGHPGSPIDLNYTRTKFKFVWHPDVRPEDRYAVSHLLIFTPQDDPMTPELDESLAVEVLDTLSFDDLSLAQSPPWTIDIATLKPGKLGTVSLAAPQISSDPGKIHLGFDPPNSSENDDPHTYWASVVQGGTNTVLNLDLSRLPPSAYEWKIADTDTSRVDISPRTFTSSTTKLTITGLNTGSNIPEATTLSLVPTGSNGPAILTLKAWVLPQREMGLAVYVLEDPNAPLTRFASAPTVPLPSNAEILAVVNDSMQQAGVRFTLHPSSGTYSFPYDTRGYNLELGYSDQLPGRTSDGRLSLEEKTALFDPFGSRPGIADGIFPVQRNDPQNRRIILIKESAVPYDSINAPNGPMVRGLPGGIVLFVRNLPQQVALAAAHEVGHTLGSPQGLSTANDDGGGGHDQPPYSYAVSVDQPNGVPPLHPGNAIYQHKATPNRALMQSGAPEPAGLPWVYGRWMRNEDWRRANRGAGGLSDE